MLSKNAWSLSTIWNPGSTQQNLGHWMALSFPFAFMTPSAFLRPLPGSLYSTPLLQMNSTVYCHSILPDRMHFNTSLFSLQKCLNSSHIHFWDDIGWPMNWLVLLIIAALEFSRETETIRYMDRDRDQDTNLPERRFIVGTGLCNYGNWEVPWSDICKLLENQESHSVPVQRPETLGPMVLSFGQVQRPRARSSDVQNLEKMNVLHKEKERERGILSSSAILFYSGPKWHTPK